MSVIDWTLDSIAMDIGKIRLNNRFFFPHVDVSQGHSSGRKIDEQEQNLFSPVLRVIVE